jgi:Ca2+/H+ antiporter, TMEM165/GDT1 family
MPAPRRFDSPAWKVFGTTFVTIFLAELGDKTQVSTLLMSAESHQPWTIFAGAATALISTSLLGVLVGCWLAARISPQVLDRAAGITLAILSVWLFWEVLG